jgi:hypothetical protein
MIEGRLPVTSPLLGTFGHSKTISEVFPYLESQRKKQSDKKEFLSRTKNIVELPAVN